MCRSSDLEPWAYVKDNTTGRLYEVGTQYGALTQRSVRLIDAGSPVDEPRVTCMLMANALKRLELVRPAPNVNDIATAPPPRARSHRPRPGRMTMNSRQIDFPPGPAAAAAGSAPAAGSAEPRAQTGEGPHTRGSTPSGDRRAARTLPDALGLCPVHADEFYLPLELPLNNPFVHCPVPGCDQVLTLYVPAGAK